MSSHIFQSSGLMLEENKLAAEKILRTRLNLT